MESLVAEIQGEFEDAGCIDCTDALPALSRIGSRRITQALDPTERTRIIDAVMAVYDGYIAPFDIPGIPNLIEPAVDEMIGGALRKLLEAVAARL